MFWAWRKNWCPIEHHYLYLHGIWSYCSHVLTWVYFSKFQLVSVWRFRGAIRANVERKLCAVLFLCFFSHGRKSLAIGKGLNPRMTSQQPNLSRNCDLRISLVFSCRILPTRTISLFFASVTECTRAFRFWSLDSSGAPHYGSLFTFLTWPCSIPDTK